MSRRSKRSARRRGKVVRARPGGLQGKLSNLHLRASAETRLMRFYNHPREVGQVEELPVRHLGLEAPITRPRRALSWAAAAGYWAWTAPARRGPSFIVSLRVTLASGPLRLRPRL